MRINRIALIAAGSVMLYGPPASADDGYSKCAAETAVEYGKFCYQISDIILATRAKCRRFTSELFNDAGLTSGAKLQLIKEYMDVRNEYISMIVLDFRTQKKIDCGQFNTYIHP